MRRAGVIFGMALAIGLAVLLALQPKVAAAEGEWCAAIRGGSAWDAATRTCTVDGPIATLNGHFTILPDETLFVTSRVMSMTLNAKITNYGSLAFWAFDAENKGRLTNYGIVAVAGTLANSGEFWNYRLLRIFNNFSNLGTLTNYGDVVGFRASNISTLGTISNVRKASFTSAGLISNAGVLTTECGASFSFDAAQFAGNTIQQETQCDTTPPKAAPTVVKAPNGATVVLWNWVDNEGGAGIDLLNCQAMTTVRHNGKDDVEVTATCSDRDGNQDSAVFTVPGGGTEPPVCDSRHATIMIRLVANPDSERDVRVWGAYGTFLLDAPGVDDGDDVPNSITYDEVLPGTHNFAASLPFDWWLEGVSCEPKTNCRHDMAYRSVGIAVQACDNVTATFSALQKGSLRVHAYDDRDGDGQQQEGEPGSNWWWSDLKVLKRDGGESLVASNFNDDNGEWDVLGLIPNQEYRVCQKPRDGWKNTQPGTGATDERGWACYSFTLKSAEGAEVWFGYTQGEVATVASSVLRSGLQIHEGAASTVFLFLPSVSVD